MKKVINMIGLLFTFSGIWIFLRVIIIPLLNISVYKSFSGIVGVILLIVGVSTLAIGYGIEHKNKRVVKVTLSISFIFYLVALIDILFIEPRVFQPNMQFLQYIRQWTNIIPFKNISTYVKALFNGRINMDTILRNLVGNFMLFLPMGIYLPYFIKRIGKINVYCICLIVALFMVELVQLIGRIGVFDIDDIILRFIGAFVGYLIWKNEVVQKNLY